jgi:hypothetical protein
MTQYPLGAHVIARAPYLATRRLRNCRIAPEVESGIVGVNVFSHGTNTWYWEVIYIELVDIAEIGPAIEW